MDMRTQTRWRAQLLLACQALGCGSRDGPVLTIDVEGRFAGPAGQAVPVLLLARRLAEEHGLRHQASMRGHTLRLRLSRADPRCGGF